MFATNVTLFLALISKTKVAGQKDFGPATDGESAPIRIMIMIGKPRDLVTAILEQWDVTLETALEKVREAELIFDGLKIGDVAKLAPIKNAQFKVLEITRVSGRSYSFEIYTIN